MIRSGDRASFIVKDRNAFVNALKDIEEYLEQVHSPKYGWESSQSGRFLNKAKSGQACVMLNRFALVQA